MFNTRVDFLDLESWEEVHQTLDRDADDLASSEVRQQPGCHLHLILGTGGRALECVQESQERDRDTFKIESCRRGVRRLWQRRVGVQQVDEQGQTTSTEHTIFNDKRATKPQPPRKLLVRTVRGPVAHHGPEHLEGLGTFAIRRTRIRDECDAEFSEDS